MIVDKHKMNFTKRLMNTFSFGRLKRHETSQQVQVENLYSEVSSKLPHIQEHGFYSKAPIGSLTASIFNGGNRESGAVLKINGEPPFELDEGDSLVYNSDGSYCHLEGGIAKLQGDVYDGLIKINELTAKINALIVEVRTHKHSSSGDIPVTTFTDFTKADYENTKVKHG